MLLYILLFAIFAVGNASRCHWINSTFEAVSYQQCLRTERDLVSDRLKMPKTNGIYQDCILLIDIWKRLGVGYSNPSAWFVDAGSNIGSCGLLMAAHGIQTIAFEPNPDNLFYLRSSVNHNYPISAVTRVVGIGLGDVAASFPIYVQAHNAGNSVIGAAVQTEARPAHIVNIRTLDSMIPDGVTIPLMKVDVQGFEYKLLSGARRLLEKGEIFAIFVFTSAAVLMCFVSYQVPSIL